MIELAPPARRRLKRLLYGNALIAIARQWRKLRTDIRYVGITGSAGKTTTKDLLVRALGGPPRVAGNSDSNNQLYGIARTLLRAGPRTTHVVQEVGAGDPGAVASLTSYLRPDVALVLNVGRDHASALGGIEGVAAEKLRLAQGVGAGGLVLLNADDARVAAMAAGLRARVLTFGTQAGDYRARVTPAAWPQGIEVEIVNGSESVRVRSSFLAPHHAWNVLAASAAAHALGVPLQLIAARLQGCSPMHARGSLQHLQGDISFIRDDWKAPAWSLEQALASLDTAAGRRRWVVIGTLSDYTGDARKVYERAVAAALAHAEQVVLVGARAGVARAFEHSHPGRVRGYGDVRAAAEALSAELGAGDVVLLKGSNRADHLARIALQVAGRQVRCWRARCGRQAFCDSCARVRRHAS